MTKSLVRLAAAATLAGPLFAGGAFAQSDGTGSVSDPMFDKYVDAYLGVREVSQSYRNAASQADGDEELAEVRAEYREELRQVVQDAGLTVEQYNEIYKTVENDRELRERLQDRAAREMQNGG